jgi:hypothetical protein
MTGAVAAVAIGLQLVSVNSQGVQGDGHSSWADVSRDGQLVVFESSARNLSSQPLQRPDDQEVYMRNRRSGRTRMVSLNSRGRASNAWSTMPALSPNGRYVAFCSTASNLVRPDRRPRVPHTGPGVGSARRRVRARPAAGRDAAGEQPPARPDGERRQLLPERRRQRRRRVRVRGDRSCARRSQPLHRDVRVGLELAARARHRAAARRAAP